MRWKLSHRADAPAVAIADRHYSRQKPGTPQFVPPGACLVLLTDDHSALWVTSWPLPEYTKHEWAGDWVCSLFRNEGKYLSSELIREAISCTRWHWAEAKPTAMVTFVNADKVRHKRDPGRCFVKAGFHYTGTTKGGLLAFRIPPDEMPESVAPVNAQLRLLLEQAG